MTKLLLIGVAFAALMAPAMAQAQAPVLRRPVVAVVDSWTGYYVGGNVGYSWGEARTDLAGSGSTATFVGFPFTGSFPSSAAFANSGTARLNGVIGGGQIGYNNQFSPRWVWGLEADVQASGERGSITPANSFLSPACTQVQQIFIDDNEFPTTFCTGTGLLNGTAATALEARIAWFGTVRGRLGFLITDQILLYGTGGLAYGKVQLSGTTFVNALGALTVQDVPPFNIAANTFGGAAFNGSNINLGYAVGVGIEGKLFYWLPANWSWKFEYLYIDLGSLDVFTPFAGGSLNPTTLPLTGTLNAHARFTDNIVRVGLNYKFGSYYAPVVAR